MGSWNVRFLTVFLLCTSLIACQRQEDDAAPMVTPAVTLARADATVGSPVEMTYRFAVAPGAKFNEDYWVFVHFLDADRELMWTDDHQPTVSTRQWQPGQTIEYTRTTFIPKFPYVGETRVEVGLFSPTTGDRVPMAGNNQGQRSYQVATFNLGMQSDNLFVVFKDGWQATEVSSEGIGVEWQWSKKEGVLAVRNPMRDVMLYLQVDQPLKAIPTQHVDVRIGTTIVDSFDLPAGAQQLRKVRISKDQFGTGESAEIAIVAARTFVPAAIPELKSSDARELGVRVFRAFLQPL
jgi:hypothetical protein